MLKVSKGLSLLGKVVAVITNEFYFENTESNCHQITQAIMVSNIALQARIMIKTFNDNFSLVFALYFEIHSTNLCDSLN